MLQTDIERLEILCRERFKTIPCRSLLKLHLSLDIDIVDISPASRGLLEKAARIELIQPADDEYSFVQFIWEGQIKLRANVMPETWRWTILYVRIMDAQKRGIKIHHNHSGKVPPRLESQPRAQSEGLI